MKNDITKTKEIDRFAYIRALLVLAGVKNKDLVSLLSVSPQTINRVLYGKAKSRRVQQAVADLLNRSFEELWSNLA